MHIPDTGHRAEVQGGRDSEVEKMGPDVDWRGEATVRPHCGAESRVSWTPLAEPRLSGHQD